MVTAERIRIDYAATEGAILRLVGLVERRGFRVVSLQMAEDDRGGASMTLDIEPRDATRRTEILMPQINRIHGVRAVTLFTPAQASAA